MTASKLSIIDDILLCVPTTSTTTTTTNYLVMEALEGHRALQSTQGVAADHLRQAHGWCKEALMHDLYLIV